MEYLLFKLTNKDFHYAIVSPGVLYLLDESEYALLKEKGSKEVLDGVKQINKDQILKLAVSKRIKEVTIYDLKELELIKLNFETHPILKQFVKAFPGFKKEKIDSKTRIHPINALLLILFTYSFIWAGTRPSSADINPEGIRWRIAYLNVQFLEWLSSLVGQRQIMIIGVALLIFLLYQIFRPELYNIFKGRINYFNTTVKRTPEHQVDSKRRSY